MAKRKTKKKYSSSQRTSWKAGFFAGLFAKNKKHKKKITKKKSNFKKSGKSKASLNDYHRRYRERNLGALLFGGKIYDTNFKDGPHEITKEDIQKLRSEYDFDGKRTDLEVADSYVRHMRRKYGVYDENGNWLGLGGDV